MRMSQENLTKVARGANVRLLTDRNFDRFVGDLSDLFEPRGSKIMQLVKLGRFSETERMIDWGYDHPTWEPIDERGSITFRRVVRPAYEDQEMSVALMFHGGWDQVFTVEPSGEAIKYTFDRGVGLYLRDDKVMGNEEFPRETLYLRRDKMRQIS